MEISNQRTYRCPSCEQIKPSTEFGKSSRTKRGLQYYCKPCINRKSEERRQERIVNGPSIIRDAKACPRCNNLKPISQFPKYKSSADGHVSYCKPCWVTITQKAQAKQRKR